MEIIEILLVSDDLDYAYTLAKCVAAKNNRFLFSVINRLQFQNKSHFNKYDLLLLDGESQVTQKPFIQLVEKRLLNSTAEEQQHYLYKYENVSCFESQLLFFYGFITGRKEIPLQKDATKILTFHSSRGGSGKTSIALALAQELRRFHDKKVIYINYEEIDSLDLYFSCKEGSKTLSDYLYCINSKENLSSYVNSFTITDEYGVEAFVPSEGRNELKLLNKEELSVFFEHILEDGGYDFIIIDCDVSLTKECLWILSISDQIIMVEKYKETNHQEKLKKYITFCLGDFILEKVITVMNFYEGMQERNQEAELFIDYDKESFKNQGLAEAFDYKRIDIDKDFGLGIKGLYEKLTLNLQ